MLYNLVISQPSKQHQKSFRNRLACGAFVGISIEGGGEPNQPPEAKCAFPSTCLRAGPERIGSRG
ncbi:MAG TPA: hypothetical protein DCK93_04705 [Blastocatellia bacterium]|nr:hypothetical protein [Blastocatellia bacterium]